CRAKDGSEVAIASGEVPGKRRVKRDVLFAIVANGVDVVAAGAEKAVHQSMVIFDAGAIVGMVRVGMRPAGVVAGKRMSRMGHADAVHVRQPSLLAVGVRQPAEK